MKPVVTADPVGAVTEPVVASLTVHGLPDSDPVLTDTEPVHVGLAATAVLMEGVVKMGAPLEATLREAGPGLLIGLCVVRYDAARAGAKDWETLETPR